MQKTVGDGRREEGHLFDPRRRSLPAEGSVRSRSLHPSRRLLRHRFAITRIRQVPPSDVPEGGLCFAWNSSVDGCGRQDPSLKGLIGGIPECLEVGGDEEVVLG